jgi:hypothetical protein
MSQPQPGMNPPNWNNMGGQPPNNGGGNMNMGNGMGNGMGGRPQNPWSPGQNNMATGSPMSGSGEMGGATMMFPAQNVKLTPDSPNFCQAQNFNVSEKF